MREARFPEADRVASLVNDAYGRTSTPSGWTSEDDILEGPRIKAADVEELLAREGSQLLAAETDGEIVGCVHLQRIDEEACELGLLSVRADEQDQGLGQRILAAGETHARERGADRIVLKVLTVREELIAWYERRGYEPTGETERFEPDGPQRSLVGPLSFAVMEKGIP